MAGTLYPPAFAALTRWWGRRRVTALTALTLLAGLSSTVFAPLTATLLDHLQWQRTYLVLAGVLAAVTIPAHYFGLRGPWPKPDTADQPAHAEQAPDAIARSRPFLLLTTAIALGTFTAFAVIVNQVPLLLERGLTTQVRRVGARARRPGAGPGPAGLHPAHRRDQRPVPRGAHPRAHSDRDRPARTAARTRRAAHRRCHARRRRPRRSHPPAGHRHQRPLGRRPLRPAQRAAVRPGHAGHSTRHRGPAPLSPKPSVATRPCSPSSPAWPPWLPSSPWAASRPRSRSRRNHRDRHLRHPAARVPRAADLVIQPAWMSIEGVAGWPPGSRPTRSA